MGKKDRKKKKKEEEEQGIKKISSNKILVKVYKDFGSNTAILKAEYEAEERRDSYNNLISVNKEYLHAEDTDFSIDDVYNEMQVILEFKNKSKEEKLKILKKKIEYEEKLITYLEKFEELNAMFNYADERLRLHDYKLFKEYVEKQDEVGAYFTIEKGQRVYSFDSVDGFLVPIWRGVATHTQYPDHTRKKKIIIQEDLILQKELQQYNRDKKIGNILLWGLIAITILFSLNIWGAFKLLAMHQDMETTAHEGALQCVEYTAKLNTIFADAIAKKVIPSPEEDEVIEQTIEELKPDKIG